MPKKDKAEAAEIIVAPETTISREQIESRLAVLDRSEASLLQLIQKATGELNQVVGAKAALKAILPIQLVKETQEAKAA